MVQVILGHPAEAKLIEVAEGDCREGHLGGGHLIQLGDMRVAEVVLDPFVAGVEEQGQGAQETEGPEDALDEEALVGEDVGQAMQRGAAGKDLDADGLPVLHLLFVHLQVHHAGGLGQDGCSGSAREKGQATQAGILSTSTWE